MDHLENAKLYDRDGKEITPKDAILNGGFTLGMHQDGQAILKILMNGVIEVFTLNAANEQDFLKIMETIAKIVYKKQALGSPTTQDQDKT